MTQSLDGNLGHVPKSQDLLLSLGRAVTYAQGRSHRLITLEHILYALIDDADASAVLDACNIDVMRLRADVLDYISSQMNGLIEPGNVSPQSSIELQKVASYAAAAAKQSGRPEIDGAIFLAALIGEGTSAAAQIINRHGLTFDIVISNLKKKPEAEPAAEAQSQPPASKDRSVMSGSDNAPLLSQEEDLPMVLRRHEPASQPPPQPLRPVESPDSGEKADAGFASDVTESPPPASASHPPDGEVDDSVDDILASVREIIGVDESGASKKSEDYPREVDQDREQTKPPVELPHPTSFPPPPPSPSPVLPKPAGYVGNPPVPVPERSPVGGPAEQFGGHPEIIPPQAGRRGLNDRTGSGAPPLDRRYMAPDRPPPPQNRPPYAAPPPGGFRPASPQQYPPQGQPMPYPQGAPRSAPQPPVPYQNARPPARPRPPIASSIVQQGQLVENIPRKMRVEVPVAVEVRIARSEVEDLEQGMPGGHHIRGHSVYVTEAMTVQLRAPKGGFVIEGNSPETQWLDNKLGIYGDDFAGWRWNVTPKKRGSQKLQLVISARTVDERGMIAESAMPEQVIDVKVRINYLRLFGRLVVWAAIAVCGGALSTYGESLLNLAKKFI